HEATSPSKDRQDVRNATARSHIPRHTRKARAGSEDQTDCVACVGAIMWYLHLPFPSPLIPEAPVHTFFPVSSAARALALVAVTTLASACGGADAGNTGEEPSAASADELGTARFTAKRAPTAPALASLYRAAKKLD